MTQVIDAHQHFWQMGRYDYSWMNTPELAPLRRDFLPQDLEPLTRRVGVDHTIFVQTVHNLDENRWVLALTDRYEFIVGVVGWVDLTSEAVEDQLAEFEGHPKFVGIRHQTHDEQDDDWIVRGDVLCGLTTLERHGVPFELLFFTRHLKHVATLARRLPELKMVIDHLAKPRIREQRTDDWLDDIKEAARYPNVYCKLSGMITEADWKNWKPADLEPYVQTVLEQFGADRLMFGSDWPVCTLAGSYEEVYHALLESLGPISESERMKIFGDTARRFYNLQL